MEKSEETETTGPGPGRDGAVGRAQGAALITGASGAIGGATARAFARAGYALALTYFHNEPAARALVDEIESGGGRALALALDARRPEDCRKVVADAAAHFGRLDVLVHSAGIARDELLVRTKDDDWRDVIGVNLSGAFALARAAAALMIRRRSGCIINVSSIAARIPAPGQAAYAASKGALESLTRALAVELGPKGIRVNAVAPGRLRSPMSEAVNRREEDRLVKRIPLRRYGTPEEVAGVVLFLATDQAAYLTGQIITLDGGLSLAAKA